MTTKERTKKRTVKVDGVEIEVPSMAELERWTSDCGCEAVCPEGCWVEPDGHCEHGHPSWLIYLGWI